MKGSHSNIKKQKNVEMEVSGHTCMTVLVDFSRSLGLVLNSLQTRNAQASLNFPLPPNFGMSRQFLQSPQFSFLQPEHLPHLFLLPCGVKDFFEVSPARVVFVLALLNKESPRSLGLRLLFLLALAMADSLGVTWLILTLHSRRPESVVPSSAEDDAFGLFLTLLMGDSFGALGDDLALHFAFCARISQIFLNVPLPPFFGLSLQDLQFPQSSI